MKFISDLIVIKMESSGFLGRIIEWIVVEWQAKHFAHSIALLIESQSDEHATTCSTVAPSIEEEEIIGGEEEEALIWAGGLCIREMFYCETCKQ